MVEHLRYVQRRAQGTVADLVAATETVGDDQRLPCGIAHGGQQRDLPHPHRALVVPRLVAERARHAAAARLYRTRDEPRDPAQYGLHRPSRRKRFLMAVRMD